LPQAETFRVEGYREFMRACTRAEPDTKRYVRQAFRQVGDAVRADASSLFAPYDARSAARFRTYITQNGVAVGQSLRKTTGKRGDYGALQMRKALLPALHRQRHATEQAFEHAIDQIADRFESGG